MVGDLTFDVHLMQNGHVPGLGERAALRASTRALSTLWARYPDLAILPAHDPAAGMRLSASSWGQRTAAVTARHRTAALVQGAEMEIDALEPVQLGGITQWIRIRGTDASNPVLLLMQQGPGLPIINEARAWRQRLGLEKDFTVVYWDQRGTGLSALPLRRG